MGKKDNIAVAFWSFYFMGLSCSYWGALELGRASILVSGYYTAAARG